jgi:hypothetical protein
MNMLGIFGEKGTGKSYRLARIIEAHRRSNRRFFVCRPYDAILGHDVGTVDDFLGMERWPDVARFDDKPERVAALALKLGSTTVVADEISTWAGRHATDEQRAIFTEIAERGRHHSVYLIYTTQHPFSVCDTIRSHTYSWIFHRITGQTSLNFITGQYGRTASQTISGLGPYQAIYCDPDQGLRSMESIR